MSTLAPGSRVNHPAFGFGVVFAVHKLAYDVSFQTYGVKTVPRDYAEWEIKEALPYAEVATFNEAEQSLVRILRSFNAVEEIVPLGDKWIDGILSLQPGDPDLKAKDMPIDVFFNKIIMVRDRLRVLEQRVNNSSLSNEEKVNMQQYITRSYASFTSFNVLFKRKEDSFKGTGK